MRLSIILLQGLSIQKATFGGCNFLKFLGGSPALTVTISWYFKFLTAFSIDIIENKKKLDKNI